MSFTIDANLLIYSVEPSDKRALRARELLSVAHDTDCVLTNQALGEFLNIVRRKRIVAMDAARLAVSDWQLIFPVLPTTTDHLIAASRLAERHRLQFWDSVILTIAGAAGVDVLLSEDMQDGAILGGVRLLNPFNPENGAAIDALLTSES